jgi:ribokinase
MGVEAVLVTDGAAGAFLATAERILFCPVVPTAVAGTAGAGDAFAATLACGLAEGRDPETALRAGALNAAGVVEHVDTQTGLLARSELEAALSGRGARIHVRSWSM